MKPTQTDASPLAGIGDRAQKNGPASYDVLARELTFHKAQHPVKCPMNTLNARCYGAVYTTPEYASGTVCGKGEPNKPVESAMI